MKPLLICITGPTASSKTTLAAHLALRNSGEIISADSRQVYKRMDIGTGKDLADYVINGTRIPYHLIDIAEPGEKYTVFDFQKDFVQAFINISEQNKMPILCGGSVLYLDSVLRSYKLIQVPINSELRNSLENKSMSELIRHLSGLKKLHNTSDIDSRKRAIRAIEIEEYQRAHPQLESKMPEFDSLIFGVLFSREDRRKRITERLKQRLESGMIDEVKLLLESGVAPADLIYYGLEYKFLTQYILGEISYNELFEKLNVAIHQFAKRQMTWFRKLEREGVKIHWIDGNMAMKEKLKFVEQKINVYKACSKY